MKTGDRLGYPRKISLLKDLAASLSPRWGSSAFPPSPTAYAVGCILAPLRGWFSRKMKRCPYTNRAFVSSLLSCQRAFMLSNRELLCHYVIRVGTPGQGKNMGAPALMRFGCGAPVKRWVPPLRFAAVGMTVIFRELQAQEAVSSFGGGTGETAGSGSIR